MQLTIEGLGKQMGDSDSLGDFKQLFSGADFHNGLELSFSSTQEGALATRIGDKEVQHTCLSTLPHDPYVMLATV